MKLDKKKTYQPRKVRKRMLYDAPLHKKQKMMVAPLAPEAREKYGIRKFGIRTGDKVIVRKGKYRETVGKVIEVDLRRLVVYVDSVTRKRSDGRTVNVPIKPWNLAILELDLSDEKRKAVLERKKGVILPVEIEEKTETESVTEPISEEIGDLA